MGQGDAQGLDWEGLAWSPWLRLDGAEAAGVPPAAGIYRLRCHSRGKLIYIGISSSLRARLSGLHRARRREDKRGHYAAACVAAHEARGEVIEVSWVVVAGVDRRELMGLEVDLIAAHRKLFGSPACQFHGQLEI